MWGIIHELLKILCIKLSLLGVAGLNGYSNAKYKQILWFPTTSFERNLTETINWYAMDKSNAWYAK